MTLPPKNQGTRDELRQKNMALEKYKFRGIQLELGELIKAREGH